MKLSYALLFTLCSITSLHAGKKTYKHRSACGFCYHSSARIARLYAKRAVLEQRLREAPTMQKKRAIEPELMSLNNAIRNEQLMHFWYERNGFFIR